jgi:hypothetical protein
MKWSIKRPFSPINQLIYSASSAYYSRKYPAAEFIPEQLIPPGYTVSGPSAWSGLEKIIAPLIAQFELKTANCIEFGVEKGYSTAVFAQLFDKVTGVDTFEGDRQAGYRDTLEVAKSNLQRLKNVTLIKDNYQHYITTDDSMYDLCHVDIIHTYKDTFACGEWAVKHAKCVIFHDTESYPAVRKAVFDLSVKYGKKFYNYPKHHGLGILI